MTGTRAYLRSGAVLTFLLCWAGWGRPACYAEEAILARELRAHAEHLASDALEGRRTGTAGIHAAETYIALSFSRYGLTPVPGERDLFLDFTLYRHSYVGGRTSLTLSRGPKRWTARLGSEFRPFWFSRTGSADAEVVFAGYGITAPEHDWDDYAGLDVRGKLVLLLRHEPGGQDPRSPFDGAAFSRHAYFVTKAENAARHGASGMILFTDPLFPLAGAEDLRADGSLSLTAGPGRQAEEVQLLAAHISQELVAELISPLGFGLAELQRRVNAGARPRDIALGGLRASLRVAPPPPPQRVAARDVAAFLPGSDQNLADRWIVIGAHHDHLGALPDGPGDRIYNGADDNASGTAGVIELAEHFALGPLKPARSLVFLTFSAEEEGLLGSRVLFANRLLPAGRVELMVNLDMIGRNPGEPVTVFGESPGVDLEKLVDGAAKANDLDARYAGSGPSSMPGDYGPFHEAGVPFLAFFTGEHQDYHQLTDQADRLDYDRMEKIVRTVSDVIRRWELLKAGGEANAGGAPRFSS